MELGSPLQGDLDEERGVLVGLSTQGVAPGYCKGWSCGPEYLVKYIPELLAFITCENGEFKVLDSCSPKQCGFLQGAILLSVKCRSED